MLYMLRTLVTHIHHRDGHKVQIVQTLAGMFTAVGKPDCIWIWTSSDMRKAEMLTKPSSSK